VSDETKEKQMEILPGVTYECVRCGTRTSGDELAKLPELRCPNCGYRIFRKVRGSLVKDVKAE
jgi:DNA-directed RNA polymerase subunit P